MRVVLRYIGFSIIFLLMVLASGLVLSVQDPNKDLVNDSVYRLFEQLQNDFMRSSPLLEPIPAITKRSIYIGSALNYIKPDSSRGQSNHIFHYSFYTGIDAFQYISFDLSHTNFNLKINNNTAYNESIIASNILLYPNLKWLFTDLILELYFKYGLNYVDVDQHIPSPVDPSHSATSRSKKIGDQLGVGLLWYLPSINNWRLRAEYVAQRNRAVGDFVDYRISLGMEYLTGYSSRGDITASGFDRRYRFIGDNSFIIYYDPAQYKLSSHHTAILQRVITYLRNDSNLRVLIAGHSDGATSEGYSLEEDYGRNNKLNARLQEIELSQKRSEYVQNYFIQKGIDSSKLIIAWYGATSLTKKELAADGSHNRRVITTLIRSLQHTE